MFWIIIPPLFWLPGRPGSLDLNLRVFSLHDDGVDECFKGVGTISAFGDASGLFFSLFLL